MAPTPAAPSMVKAVDLYIGRLEAGEELPDVELQADPRKEEFIRTQQHKLAKKSRARRPSVSKK